MPTAQQMQTLWKAINWPEGRHLRLFFHIVVSSVLHYEPELLLMLEVTKSVPKSL